MAFALISSTSKGATAGAAVTTDAIDTTGANLLVVVVGYYDPSGNAVVEDSKSNSWNQLTEYGAGDEAVRIYYSVPTSVGSGHTFTDNVAHFSTICAAAFSGAHASPFDAQNGTTLDAITAISTNISPGEDNQLVVAGCCVRGNAEFGLVSIDSGFTIATQQAGVSSHHLSGALAYLIQTTAASVTPEWSWTNSDNASAAIVAFQPATVVSVTSAVRVNPHLRRKQRFMVTT